MGNEFVVDFLVIGAGMAGASAAACLAEMGRVAVLESEAHAGYHSTGRSAALFSEIYGSPVIRGLTRASRAFLFDPPSGFAASPLVAPRGAIYFARPEQMGELRAFRNDPDVRAATVEWSAAEILERVPVFRHDYLGGGAFEAAAADLDVDAIHQGFLRQVRTRNSAIYFDHEVRELRRCDGMWTARTASSSFSAPVVINAAGAWGDVVAALAGVAPVDLQPKRRTAVLIPVPGHSEAHRWPAAVDISEQFYFKPDAGLLLLSPADETSCLPSDVQPEELDVAIAIDRFEQATGCEVRELRRSWAGLRVFAPDRNPVVGFDPEAEGFFWLVGQGGYGIQTAPALGRVAAALASRQPMPHDVGQMGITTGMLSAARFSTAR